MIYRYLRFSTDKQDERSQENIIDNYLSGKGMNYDATYIDEGISGGVSYKQRNLYELCKELQANDCVIISEISRLTRSGIGELSEIIEKHFKPNKLRLIICNVGLDIDCGSINPMIEMQLAMLATFSKIEKQLIIDRTKAALESRQKNGQEIGGTNNLWGKNTGTNREEALESARNKSAESRREKAKANESNKRFYDFLEDWESIHGRINKDADFDSMVEKLNKRGLTTSTGMDFNKTRAQAMISKIKTLYA